MVTNQRYITTTSQQKQYGHRREESDDEQVMSDVDATLNYSSAVVPNDSHQDLYTSSANKEPVF